MDTIVERRRDNLWREQRCGDRPRCDGAVAGTVGYASSHLVEELTVDPGHGHSFRAGPRSLSAPAILAVMGKLERVVDCVLTLHISGPLAVLEIVDPVVTHERSPVTARIEFEDGTVGTRSCRTSRRLMNRD